MSGNDTTRNPNPCSNNKQKSSYYEECPHGFHNYIPLFIYLSVHIISHKLKLITKRLTRKTQSYSWRVIYFLLQNIAPLKQCT